MPETVKQHEPAGERIQINVRLFSFGPGPDAMLPKRAWTHRAIRREEREQRNPDPGRSAAPDPLGAMPSAIETVLIASGIVPHSSARTKRYLKTQA